MKFIDLLSMCFTNLFQRKVRTIMTLLGIALGVMSVTMTMAMGGAIKSNNQKVLESKGNLREIEVSVAYNYGKEKKQNKAAYLDDKLIKNLKEIDEVAGVWAELNIDRNILVSAGKNNRYVFQNLVGVFMDDLEEFGYKMLSGKIPTQKTLEGQKKVEVLAGQYFEYDFTKTNVRDWKKSTRYYNSPMEKYFREKYDYGLDTFELKPPFVEYGKDDMFLCLKLPEDSGLFDNEMVDIMTGKSESSFDIGLDKDKYKKYDLEVTGRLNGDVNRDSNDYRLRRNSDEKVLIDMDLAKEIVKSYKKLNHIPKDEKTPEFVYNNVKVRVKDVSMVESVSQKISKLGFEPTNKLSDIEKEQAKTKSNQLVLGFLGAITLFVASLSVANTMFTSMYERTKEIGVMKVIGCKVSNIKILFVLESAILGLIGGVLGMTITYFVSNFMNGIVSGVDADSLTGVAKLLSTYMEMMKYDKYSEVKLDIAVIDSKLWIYAILGSVLVAMISAYIPARKASKISALSSMKEE